MDSEPSPNAVRSVTVKIRGAREVGYSEIDLVISPACNDADLLDIAQAILRRVNPEIRKLNGQ